MIVRDKIYGNFKINESVLNELINSKSLKRLKNISQFGIPDQYYSFKGYTRYEHSIGVMLLLKKLNASLEEQVAGLLHDVSVLAFSHISDWVFGEGRKGVEDYHNMIHDNFVKQTVIPKLLQKYNLSVERILDEKNFGLLERKIPDLCADRIDYALREFKYWLNPKIIEEDPLHYMINYNGEIVFSDSKAAFIFATSFLDLQRLHWGAAEPVKRYSLFSDVLKVALKNKIISEKDFYKDEKIVLSKIETSKNSKVKKLLLLLKKGYELRYNKGEKVFKKFRYVDPKVLIKGNLKRLSKVNTDFKKILMKNEKINKEGIIV